MGSGEKKEGVYILSTAYTQHLYREGEKETGSCRNAEGKKEGKEKLTPIHHQCL